MKSKPFTVILKSGAQFNASQSQVNGIIKDMATPSSNKSFTHLIQEGENYKVMIQLKEIAAIV